MLLFTANIYIFVPQFYNKMDSIQEDKSLPFVTVIIIAIAIGFVGIYLRFAGFKYCSEIADVIFLIATVIAFRTVFAWMKVRK
jgi:hypothetical protein